MFHLNLADLLALLFNLVVLLITCMILLALNIFLLFGLLKLSAFLVKKLSRAKYNLKEENNVSNKKSLKSFTIGFFHPFCNSGGGGERVLWSAIKAIQDAYPNCICVVYTGDRETKPEDIIKNANDRLNIQLSPTRTKFIYLRLRFLVLDKYYPIFTLLGQSLGSMVLGIEALFKFIPDIFFETTGYAFTYPLFNKIANIPVCCYTHYPTISTDMLKNITRQNASFNNRKIISRSLVLTNLKLIYYRLFAKIYSLCGRCSTCVMVNSSWTQAHINDIWSLTYRTKIVYPPCDVVKFESVFDNKKHDENFYIASVAQIRPEKNHQLQIRSFAKFLEKVKKADEKAQINKIKLFIIGSCRNEDDLKRADSLKHLAKSLGIDENVEFKLNFKFELLLDILSQSAVGIHTMIDEHFGIGVVECMASGLVMLAHNSAGPKMDIVIPYKGEKTGFLAETEQEYSDCLYSIYTMSPNKRLAIRQSAREHVKKFSQEKFDSEFIDAFADFCFNENFDNKKQN